MLFDLPFKIDPVLLTISTHPSLPPTLACSDSTFSHPYQISRVISTISSRTPHPPSNKREYLIQDSVAASRVPQCFRQLFLGFSFSAIRPIPERNYFINYLCHKLFSYQPIPQTSVPHHFAELGGEGKVRVGSGLPYPI